MVLSYIHVETKNKISHNATESNQPPDKQKTKTKNEI